MDRKWLSATLEQISPRLKQAPAPLAELVPARLLRAAWADIRCNAIEGDLKKFVWNWAKDHQDEPAFQSESVKLVQDRANSTGEFGPHTFRERAQSYARTFLAPCDACGA